MAKAWKKTEKPIYGDARTELTAPVREIVVLDDPEEVKSTVSPEPADGTTVDKRNGGVVSEITTYDTPSDNVGGATGEKPNSKTEEKTNEKPNDKSEETPKWTPIDEGLVDPVPGSPEDKSRQQDKKGGETAGTTVPQNNQSNTKSGGGTSASNDNGVIKVGEQNANLNYYQYGDDSNPAQQGQKGGMNPKYTGEGVSNSYIEYNPDLTVADLDPNYLYGEAARQQNSKEAGYIARRNDNIASALYNEGLTSREDVANFLSQQKEWMNSTEADRENTIESIYKRLGQMKPQEEKPDLSKADTLVTDTSNTLYGKTTADEGNPKSGIETKVDANSVLNTMEQRRSSELKNFVSTDIQSIASCVVNGTTYWDEQTWRDAQEIYPDFIAAVNAEVKKQRGQQNVTAIANGGEMSTNTDGQSNINNSIAGFGASNATSTKSSVEIAKDVHDSLAKNQTANEASATMEGIEEDMAILKNRLKNLRQEANAAFKGDVPDYLVNAYINNKTQEIQNQMSILEDRYNAAYNRYKQEVANTQWEKEYKLKERQLELAEKEFKLKDWMAKNGVTEQKETTSSNARYNQGDKWEVTKMSDEEVAAKVDILMDMYESHQLGDAQCGVGIQTYYLPMLGISLNGISTMEQKKSLINEGAGYVPKKGDLIILKGSDPKYGHIGIVTSTDDFGDGSISYIDWNGTLGEDGKGNGKPVARNIMPDDAKIIGFRNINKKNEWTDYDYTRFEQFRDSTSKSEKETIAAEYRTDIAGMSDIVRDALDSRDTDNTDDSSNTETGYDSDLGFNILHTDIYEQINQNKIDKSDMEWQAKRMGISERELGRRADNYKLAKDKGIWVGDTKDSEGGTTPGWANYKGLTEDQLSAIEDEIGYNPNWEDYYSDILTGKQKLPTTGPALENILGMTGASDARQLGKWIEHYRAKQKLIGLKAGDDILHLLAELQILYEDTDNTYTEEKDGKKITVFDTSIWQGKGMGTIGIKYEQLMKQLLLNKVTEARNKGATFGSMTEYEWKILEDAASALKIRWTSDDEGFTDEFNKIVNAYWKLTQDTKKNITQEEWQTYLDKVREENVRLQSEKSEESGVKNNPPTSNTTNTPNVPNVPNNQSKSMTGSTAGTGANNVMTGSTTGTGINNVMTGSTTGTGRQSSKDW